MQFTQIKETCLYVSDLETTKAFYSEKMGLETIGIVENRHVFFRAGTSVLLCFISEATRNDQKLPPHYGKGQMHLAFEVKVSEYESWLERVISQGIAIEHEHEWQKGLRSFYFRDPDNHLIEIVPEGLWDR